LSAIVEESLRAAETFRTAGMDAAYVTLARSSTRIT